VEEKPLRIWCCERPENTSFYLRIRLEEKQMFFGHGNVLGQARDPAK
jgi:hypothetical protein